MNLGAALLAAYLLGSVPFAYLLARARGVDLRTVGSGNIGATNAARALGMRWGALALGLDAAKGSVAVACGGRLGLAGAELVAVAAAAVLGHVFSCFMAFRGGKGVATAAGAFAALEPLALAAGLVAFGLVVGATRYVSLGSLVAGAVVAGVVLGTRGPFHPHAALAGFAVLVLVIRHRDNIARLRAGTEPRFGSPAPVAPAPAPGGGPTGAGAPPAGGSP